jgi:hypothetical protein
MSKDIIRLRFNKTPFSQVVFKIGKEMIGVQIGFIGLALWGNPWQKI